MPIRVVNLEDAVETRLVPDGTVRKRSFPDLPNRLGSMDRITIEPGGAPLALLYPSSEDSYYVLEGEGVVRAAGVTRLVRKGHFVHFPPGLVHEIRGVGARPLELAGGPCPPAPPADPAGAETPSGANGPAARPGEEPFLVRDVEDGVEIPLMRPVMPGGTARFPVWPGTGASRRSMNWVAMVPGQENVPHSHAESEDLFYCIEGNCVIEDGDTGESHPFEGGSVIFVEPGTLHAVKSLGPARYVSVGGPCPPDTALFRRLGLL